MELEDGRMMKYGRNDEIEETQRENPENPKRKWGMGTRDGKTPPPERREIFIVLGKKKKRVEEEDNGE